MGEAAAAGQSVRSLELRLKRLEDRAKRRNNRVPSVHEFLDAAFRQRTRNIYSAKLRLYRTAGREEDLWQNLSDHGRETLESGTEEQREKDADVIERSRGVHGSGEAETITHANMCLQRLRDMKRFTTGRPE